MCIVPVKRVSTPADPVDVLVARPDERAVLVGGVGVVAVAHQLEVEPVDAAAVAQHDVGDRLPVDRPAVGVSAPDRLASRDRHRDAASAPARCRSGGTRRASSSTAYSRVPGEELLQRDPRLQARHRGAEAHVRAVPEGEDARVGAGDVELVGPVELARVAVAGAEEQHHLGARRASRRRGARRRAWWCGPCTASGWCSAGAPRPRRPSPPGRRATASRWSGCDGEQPHAVGDQLRRGLVARR